jgi:hypothetical protein
MNVVVVVSRLLPSGYQIESYNDDDGGELGERSSCSHFITNIVSLSLSSSYPTLSRPADPVGWGAICQDEKTGTQLTEWN